MSDQLKETLATKQDHLCAISGEPLSEDPSLFDKDRFVPKAENGTYTEPGNTRVVDPVAHMARHNILRIREEQLEQLKSLFDDRVQIMALMLGENNRLKAYTRRVDHQHSETALFLEENLKRVRSRLDIIDAHLETLVLKYDHPLATVALNVPGLGPITVAALLSYVDFQKQVCSVCRHSIEPSEPPRISNPLWKSAYCTCKDPTLIYAAATPSSLWKYVGLDKASYERYEKGMAGGGNKTLRTVLWNSANVMMKMRSSPYRIIYDRTKTRLAASEKIVKSRNTDGKLVEVMWKDTKPSHRHGAALRAIMKHILADFWYAGRVLNGLPTVEPYVGAVLGHQHIVSPRERGWAGLG